MLHCFPNDGEVPGGRPVCYREAQIKQILAVKDEILSLKMQHFPDVRNFVIELLN